MTQELLLNEFFDWLYSLVFDKKYFKETSYRKLLWRLFDTEFIYILDMDANRADDGVNLRYRFAYENHYLDEAMITEYLDDGPCSVLEMMTALALRIEEETMSNAAAGNRTGKWFWDMIVSLGLESMDDIDYDEMYTDDVIEQFLYREYDSNGNGSLFTIDKPCDDLRTIEIWYQMLWYLDEVIRKEETYGY